MVCNNIQLKSIQKFEYQNKQLNVSSTFCPFKKNNLITANCTDELINNSCSVRKFEYVIV